MTLLGSTPSLVMCSFNGVTRASISVILEKKENYLNGGFIFYAEKNQKLKDNFEKPHNRRFPHCNKKEHITDICKTVDDPQKHCSKWKKPDTKGYVPHDSIYMTFWKRKTSETDRSVVAGNGGGGIDYKGA